MRVLEVRRHSLVRDHEHLSRAGITLARRVGPVLDPFERVVTSHITRTIETAVAMGCAVDDTWPVLGEIEPDVWAEIGHHERWTWEEPFRVFAHLIRQGEATARLGLAQATAWRSILEELPDGARALVVSHGRIIEAGAVTCLPDSDHARWGAPFGHCEGLRLLFEGDAWTGMELLRVNST